MNPNEKQSVPVVYVGNDDVVQHIKGIGPKKKTDAKVAQFAANQLAQSFGKPGKENRKNAADSVVSKSARKKKVKLDEPAKPQTTDNHHEAATNDKMKLFSFKTPKKSKQMSKFAEESARKSRAEKKAISYAEGSVKKKTSKSSGEVQFSLRLRQDNDGSVSEDSNEEEESHSDPDEEEEPSTRTSGESEQSSEHLSNQSSRRLKLPTERELYFDAHGGKKITPKITSDHTLQKLKNPRLNSDQLNCALQKHELKDEASDVDAAKEKLIHSYKNRFEKWMFYLCSNFNLLFFGLGSKRQVIHSFCDSVLTNQHKVIVNGFYPSLSVKSILTTICEDLLDGSAIGNGQDEMLTFISNYYGPESESNDHLFLIIHNIDGPPLRTANSQSALCKLASLHRIHIIASIDHINAPLAWDQYKLTRFRWLWNDVTTFAPYTSETSYEGSLLISGAGTGIGARGAALALSGLLHVARSLTSNARGVFRILAEHHLTETEQEEENNEAFSFSELYRICRERFLVNSELTLRAHLTEFVDHKLVNIQKGNDGGEYLSVPLDPTTLKEYLDYDFNQ